MAQKRAGWKARRASPGRSKAEPGRTVEKTGGDPEHSGTARPVEAGQYDLSGSGGAGHSGGLRRKQQHHHDCLDGHDLYEPADGVHFGAPGALFLPYAAGER